MSLQTVLALYRTQLQAGAFASAVELSSDLRDDLDSIPAGALRFALRPTYAGELIRSNTTYQTWQIEVDVVRKLGLAEAERTYTEGAVTGMVTQQAAIMARAFWRVAGVYDLDDAEDARELEPAERVGRVVRFTARARILLAP